MSYNLKNIMKKKMPTKKADENSIWKKKTNTFIDLGCGENKRQGCIGVDFREMPGVDIVENLSKFPWNNIPNEIADVVYSSHLLEHINPDPSNPQLAGLIDLLLKKGVVKKEEVDTFVGDYRFLGGFLRFMDEVWMKLKPGGQFISTFPYAGSPGFFQDPTHLNPITPTTLAYFDPLSKVDGTNQLYNLYTIYRPKPWKIVKCFYDQQGFIEVCLEKRKIDKSYRCSSDNGMKE